jgi:hypothetical protein
MSASPCRRGIRVGLAVIIAGLTYAALLAGTSSAAALSPWWHLTMLSRPSYLQPGKGKDEVQEVRLSSEEGFYILAELHKEARGAFTLLSASATAGEVQHHLESEVYGAGNVKVTTVPGPPGGKAYRISFVKELEDQWVRRVEVQALEGAQVSAQEVSRGRPDGVLVVNAVNLGDGNADPASEPITVTDILPAGMEALAIEGTVAENFAVGFSDAARSLECSRVALSCTFTGKPPAGESVPESYPVAVPPYQSIQVRIAVKLTGAKAGAANEAHVVGGGAPSASVRRPVALNTAPVSFGVSAYEMRPEEVGGTLDAQAGSHPFQLTTTLALNETLEAQPVALTKDLRFNLPPGVIGNPEPVARCTLGQFFALPNPTCPQSTVVGVARVFVHIKTGEVGVEDGGSITEVIPFVVPLYNLEPEAGEPARFGFVPERFFTHPNVILDTEVRTGGDYGVTVDVRNITQLAEFTGSEVTFWGVPGDERHNNSRGEVCLGTTLQRLTHKEEYGECPPFEAHRPPPLLSLPTSCTGPLLTSMEADSWADPGVFQTAGSTEALPAMEACNRLPFTPSIKVTPDGTQGSKPTGLNVDVHVPQELTLNPTGLSESEVRSITVALPEGVAIDPSGGDGLEACSEGLVGYEGVAEAPLEPGVSNPVFTSMLPGSEKSSERLEPGANFCPNASKIGTVTIHTPLLPDPLEGDVYLATQEANPFGALVAMYIVAEDPVSGTLVKLPGVVHLTASGQIVATFEDTPQLPFEDAELHFFGGERAPLTSPARCGPYTTSAAYTPWAGDETVEASSTFDVTSGPDNSPCPGASLPFAPSLTAGTTSIQAGGFSPFTMTMSREDGQQSLQAISLHMPEGLSGLLAGVELCSEADANAGTCGPNSQIGETTVGVGVGGDPFTVTGGKVFITGPYKGAAFGLSIVNPAKAGPFDLEHTAANHPACDCLVVRAKLEVNPQTAAITVTSDNEGPYKIPTIIEGIPLQIKHVNVTINRPGFIFNPTDCEKTAITGTLDSAEGASQALSVPFQATNCATLGFAPKFAVSTSGKVSRLDGTSLNVKLTYPTAAFGSQANIKQVKVELPKQLPSRLPTLQKACTAAQFHANPAGCPAASIVGHAKAITPLVPVPLEGPAYFVSNGGEAFPNLVVVLQGYGVTIDLVGDTFISKQGVTSSTFKTVPDAPVGSFELNLPAGQYSALTGLGNLCKQKLTMPTEFLAQNGAAIHQNTKVTVTGCPRASKARKQKHDKKKHHQRGRAHRKVVKHG